MLLVASIQKIKVFAKDCIEQMYLHSAPYQGDSTSLAKKIKEKF